MPHLDLDLVVERDRPGPLLHKQMIRRDQEGQIFGEHAAEILLQRLGPAIEFPQHELMPAGAADDLRLIQILWQGDGTQPNDRTTLGLRGGRYPVRWSEGIEHVEARRRAGTGAQAEE